MRTEPTSFYMSIVNHHGCMEGWDWGNFLYKKREISIHVQDIIIYHYISCCYHDISLCIIFSIMIYYCIMSLVVS